jgi:DUF2971 family protein
MAIIDRPSLPSRLYRYRSITRDDDALEQELSAITEGYIWCSAFKKLNDPMEGSYNPTTLLKGRADYKRIVNAILANKVNVGIASFSEVKHSELMWTHYTSNHAGICISYRATALMDALPDKVHMVRVAYTDAPPLISSKEASDFESATRKIFEHKKVGWQYEREWRVLGPLGKVSLDKKAGCVRSVYLGTRIRPSHRQKIIDMLKPLKIPLYEMQVNRYEHVAKQLPRKRRSSP